MTASIRSRPWPAMASPAGPESRPSQATSKGSWGAVSAEEQTDSKAHRVASPRDPSREADGDSVTAIGNPSPSPTGRRAMPATWWTEERASLAGWFDQRAPALTPLYKGAVAMVYDEGFPGRVHFVAHAVREIRNRLPEAFAGETRSRVRYGDLTEAVHESWIEDGLPSDGSSPVGAKTEPPPTGPGKVEVSEALVSAVGDLVAAHIAAGETDREKARRMFEGIGERPPPAYVVKHWLDSTQWGRQLAHARNVSLPPEHEEELTERFETFEQALIAVASRSYENMDALDEILESANR